MTEEQAIRAAKQGRPEGFAVLYGLHQKRIYAVCMRIVHNPERAEELTQDCFVLLLRRIKSFRGDSKFSSWFHRVAVNIVLMDMRRGMAKREKQTDSLDSKMEDTHFDVATRDLRVEGVVDRVILERAIEKLPEGYRTCFLLKEVHGYEHREIAALLGMSCSGGSKSQLHKAKHRLRTLLEATP